MSQQDYGIHTAILCNTNLNISNQAQFFVIKFRFKMLHTIITIDFFLFFFLLSVDSQMLFENFSRFKKFFQGFLNCLLYDLFLVEVNFKVKKLCKKYYSIKKYFIASLNVFFLIILMKTNE